jgi:hypothetical protein
MWMLIYIYVGWFLIEVRISIFLGFIGYFLLMLNAIYLVTFISDIMLILVEMREIICVGPIINFHNNYSYLYYYVSVWKVYCLQLLICRYRCLDLRRQQMSSNILLRHKVVKLIRRYLEDLHGFVEVLSSRFIIWVIESLTHRTLVVGIWYPLFIFTFFFCS